MSTGRKWVILKISCKMSGLSFVNKFMSLILALLGGELIFAYYIFGGTILYICKRKNNVLH